MRQITDRPRREGRTHSGKRRYLSFGQERGAKFQLCCGRTIPNMRFLDYPLDAMAIEWLFIQDSHVNGDRTVNFLGSHLVGPNKYSISYFSTKKYYHLKA